MVFNKSRNETFIYAKSKAQLILNNSSSKTGDIIKIEDLDHNTSSSSNGSFYSIYNTDQSDSSGFTPIVVS